MSEYTPTTESIQDAYCHVQQEVLGERGNSAHERFHTEFDRWLEAHDLAVAAKALRDAATDMRSDKYPGHWNLRVNGDPEHSASPDAWLEYRANRIEADS